MFDAGHPSGAYYWAGYAVECALKAKIAKEFREHEIPELKRIQNIYTHDLGALLKQADLTEALDAEKQAASDIYQRWEVIKTWSESARYKVWTADVASAMMDAVEGDGGILKWLQKRW